MAMWNQSHSLPIEKQPHTVTVRASKNGTVPLTSSCSQTLPPPPTCVVEGLRWQTVGNGNRLTHRTSYFRRVRMRLMTGKACGRPTNAAVDQRREQQAGGAAEKTHTHTDTDTGAFLLSCCSSHLICFRPTVVMHILEYWLRKGWRKCKYLRKKIANSLKKSFGFFDSCGKRVKTRTGRWKRIC